MPIPVLPLETNTTAFLAFEKMRDMVLAVKSDRPVTPR